MYIAAVLGGMFSHHTAILLPVVTTLIFLVAIAAAPQFRWLRLRNLIIANLVVLALYGFYIPLLLNSAEMRARWYMPAAVGFLEIQRTFVRVYANQYLPNQAVAMVALCAFALWGWRRRKDWRWLAFTLAGSLALPLMLLVISVVFLPVFSFRTIIWAAIPFYVACAVGVARLPHAGLRRIVLAVLLLCNLYGVLNEYEKIREPWDQITQTVAQAASSDGAVVICPDWVVYPFNYYWRRHERELAVFGYRGDFMVAPFLESAGGKVSKWRHQGERRDLLSLLDNYSELWIIERPYTTSDAGCDSPALRDALSARGRPVEVRRFGILKLLYVQAEAAETRPCPTGFGTCEASP